jgi:ABC-type Fe3+-citrate transport system substrate-binding protein
MVSYEEIFDTRLGVWRASIKFLETLPVDEREDVTKKILPGIVLVSQMGQQANFIHEAGYGGYTREQLIAHNAETVERMAQHQKDKAKVKKFSRANFAKQYPIAMGRSSIYNYVREHEWGELEKAYAKRCRKIRGEA